MRSRVLWLTLALVATLLFSSLASQFVATAGTTLSERVGKLERQVDSLEQDVDSLIWQGRQHVIRINELKQEQQKLSLWVRNLCEAHPGVCVFSGF